VRLSISVLGTEVFGIELAPTLYADSSAEWNGSTHTNGAFERDTEPLRADRMEPYYEEGKRIGFR
jgi:hypothetical protein